MIVFVDRGFADSKGVGIAFVDVKTLPAEASLIQGFVGGGFVD